VPAPAPWVLTVTLEAPAECPDRSALEAELSRLLGEATMRGTPLQARVRIEKPPGKVFRLRLQLKQKEGRTSERTLEGASCQTLSETAALLIAIAHDPSAVVERRPAPLIAQPPAPAREPPPAVPAVASAPAAPPWAWTTPAPLPPSLALGLVLRAGPLFGVGDLPGPHAGFAIGAALRLEAYRIDAAFELGAGSASTIDARPDAGADFVRLAGVVRGCRVIVPLDGGAWPRPSLGLDLSGCLGVELGTLSGEGFGVTNPERGSAFWAAPRADVRLGLGIAGPLGVAADVGLAVPVDPRRYVLRGGDDAGVLVVHEPAVVAGRAAIMAEIEL
jgi:hypothetical protein